MNDRKVKQVLSGRLASVGVEGGGYKERVKESKNGGILCTHEWKWKMRCAETVPGMEGGRIKESDGGVNLTVIYGKVICKCHHGPQCSNQS
jgi:hypothetical protein